MGINTTSPPDVQRDITNLKRAIDQAVGDQMSSEEMANVSRTEVLPTEPMDSAQYSGAYAAKAALSHHLTLATAACKTNQTMQIRQEFEPYVEQLKSIRMPDTRVNLGNQKIDIPWDIIDYANKVPQKSAVNLLEKFIGKRRLVELYKLSRLAGQHDKPTLWLVQKLFIETKQPYVYTIRHAPQLKETIEPWAIEKQELGCKGIEELFGGYMYAELSNIARANELSQFVIFLILFNQIAEREFELRQPSSVSSTWDVISQELSEITEVA